MKRYSFKKLVELAKEKGFELIKYKEEGMVTPLYYLDGINFNYSTIVFILTHYKEEEK